MIISFLRLRFEDRRPFLQHPSDEEFGLLFRTGGMEDLFGPTVLFAPAQVERGVFEKALSALEKDNTGVIPRLRNNGKAENNS